MITDEARAQVARGWEQSGLSQAEYARRCGISERTLRQWRRRYCPSSTSVADVRHIVEDAVAKLQALLDGLDAAAACRPETATGNAAAVAGPTEPARSAGPATPAAPQPTPAADGMPETAPEPLNAAPSGGKVQPRKKRGSFFAELGDEFEPTRPDQTPERQASPTVPVQPPPAPKPPSPAFQPLATPPRPKPVAMPAPWFVAW